MLIFILSGILALYYQYRCYSTSRKYTEVIAEFQAENKATSVKGMPAYAECSNSSGWYTMEQTKEIQRYFGKMESTAKVQRMWARTGCISLLITMLCVCILLLCRINDITVCPTKVSHAGVLEVQGVAIGGRVSEVYVYSERMHPLFTLGAEVDLRKVYYKSNGKRASISERYVELEEHSDTAMYTRYKYDAPLWFNALVFPINIFTHTVRLSVPDTLAVI